MLHNIENSVRWYDPLRQMRSAQRDMGRPLDNLRLAAPPEYPLMNIWTVADGAVITAEIPGVVPEELDIAVHQNTVTLRGSRPAEPLAEDAVIHRQERISGAFARNLILPFRVDGDRAKATFRHGVLRLDLPRPLADRPHKITVSRS
ncbi:MULTISPECIES: Hsp20/alpha crystallin family protein [unclassified Rhizobium]|uniref:Hsp20/alpha crystallin family protein n=1 Tax=unclassified Rhizobium TaxID=2613769 RepID=UPI001620CD95|nr:MULTISPECIES: Hsp20/alpha crystallin family protein [unclassified Rhizobium]MBB3320246.1 HSP20 family protein [Rhizobium sp. BK181]MBB3544752.1 HSP20 family protein [Rhizobium sp. BK399]MCS3743347.1 HSP20 family protein [Rhizobium sp. BK661]MCS4095872.1 HSP20 family protein [Rhizobium sp. BK176]